MAKPVTMPTKAFLALLLLLLFSCSSPTPPQFSFYHWKADAEYKASYDKALKDAKTEKIYLRYFDVDKFETEEWQGDGIFPTYVLKSVAQEFKSFEIVPVVYITNQVFLTKNLDIKSMSNKMVELIDQISLRHFYKKIKKIQIDCDWSQSTRAVYFAFLEILADHFELDVTIRLHQIKFQKETGVPPVEKGTLMLYNVGDLKGKEQNSILESEIVKQYINNSTEYPLTLNLALPLFCQIVIFNNDNQIKIIKNTVQAEIENDSHFKKINSNIFEVLSDTLFKGFYLSKGFNLKFEEVNEVEIINAYNTVQQSRLNIDEVIFYHLDEPSLQRLDFEKIIKKL